MTQTQTLLSSGITNIFRRGYTSLIKALMFNRANILLNHSDWYLHKHVSFSSIARIPIKDSSALSSDLLPRTSSLLYIIGNPGETCYILLWWTLFWLFIHCSLSYRIKQWVRQEDSRIYQHISIRYMSSQASQIKNPVHWNTFVLTWLRYSIQRRSLRVYRSRRRARALVPKSPSAMSEDTAIPAHGYTNNSIIPLGAQIKFALEGKGKVTYKEPLSLMYPRISNYMWELL